MKRKYLHDNLNAAVRKLQGKKKRETEETVWLDMLHWVSCNILDNRTFDITFDKIGKLEEKIEVRRADRECRNSDFPFIQIIYRSCISKH